MILSHKILLILIYSPSLVNSFSKVRPPIKHSIQLLFFWIGHLKAARWRTSKEFAHWIRTQENCHTLSYQSNRESYISTNYSLNVDLTFLSSICFQTGPNLFWPLLISLNTSKDAPAHLDSQDRAKIWWWRRKGR